MGLQPLYSYRPGVTTLAFFLTPEERMSDHDSSMENDDLENSGGQSSATVQVVSQSAAKKIFNQLKKMEKSLEGEIQSVSKRVKRLEENQAPPSKRRAAELRAASWADREVGGLENYPDDLSWPISDDEIEADDPPEDKSPPGTTISLSEDSSRLVASSFTKVLAPDDRKRLRSAFPCPELQETRCPRLDAIFKTASIQKETKVIDAELARIQALIHDPVAPLIRLLHACDDDGSSLSVEDARAAVADAIRLLGNASAGMSRLRRKKILKSVNPDIADLAEEDIFQSAAPSLFGSGFETKMKERAESVKLLSASRSGPPQPRKFFQRGRPTAPPRGGGQSNRGRTWQKREQKPSARK